MGTLGIAIQRFGQLAYPWAGKPVVSRKVQRSCRLPTAAHAALGVNLGKGRAQGGDIAAMAVEKQDMAKTVARQRLDGIAQHGDQRGGPQADGAGKVQMMLGHAQVLGWPYQHVMAFAQLPGNHFGADGIGSQQPGGTMLLGGANCNDNAPSLSQISLDFLPGGML